MEGEKHFTGHVQHSDVPPTLSVRAAVAQHTPGPWHFNGRYICAADGLNINNVSRGPDEDRANAARIVACVNALEGLEVGGTASAVAAGKRLFGQPLTIDEILAERDALRASNAELADALHEACLAAERINEGAHTSISPEVIQNWLDTLARSAP